MAGARLGPGLLDVLLGYQGQGPRLPANDLGGGRLARLLRQPRLGLDGVLWVEVWGQ